DWELDRRMRNNERRPTAGATPGPEEAAGAAPGSAWRQRLRGVAGQLRPYRDVRAGFETWRRVALRAWARRGDNGALH
ncbi:MAG: hypothetical protein ACE5EG_11215, partial [Thermoanaerobaculia bacterium]